MSVAIHFTTHRLKKVHNETFEEKIWFISYTSNINDSLHDFQEINMKSDIENDITYYFSAEKKEIIVLDRNLSIDWIAQCVLRLIRNIFRLLAMENKELFLHGGMLHREDEGIAIIGEKRAGKTTTILSCLNAGFNFVSNDDISFEFTGKNIIGNGWPRAIAVRGDSLKRIKNLENLDCYYNELEHPANKLISKSNFNGSEPNGLVFFQAKELVDTFETRLSDKKKLSKIIFPEFQNDRDYPIELIEMDHQEAFKVLSSNVMNNPGKYNEFLLDSFALPNQLELLRDKMDTLNNLKMYKLKMGFNNILDIPINLKKI